ncbi:polar growth protein [Chytridiales sp. JEL 0842]|nr:polar growth protein [Chytridiales sp. JEL 0842]
MPPTDCQTLNFMFPQRGFPLGQGLCCTAPFGVRCTADGDVLEFAPTEPGNRESADLTRIVELRNLTVLAIDGFRFVAPIPADLSPLQDLSQFIVTNSTVGGEFPKQVLDLPRLSILVLVSVNMTGTLPPSYPPQIYQINLSDNDFYGPIPPPSPLTNGIYTYDNTCLDGVALRRPDCPANRAAAPMPPTNQTTGATLPASDSMGASGGTSTGVVVGAVCGVLGVIFLSVLCLFLYVRRGGRIKLGSKVVDSKTFKGGFWNGGFRKGRSESAQQEVHVGGLEDGTSGRQSPIGEVGGLGEGGLGMLPPVVPRKDTSVIAPQLLQLGDFSSSPGLTVSPPASRSVTPVPSPQPVAILALGTDPSADVANQGPVDASHLEKKNPLDWTTAEIVLWLRSENYDNTVTNAFENHAIEGTTLPHLTIDALKNDLQITSYGLRLRLLTSIQALLRRATLNDSTLFPRFSFDPRNSGSIRPGSVDAFGRSSLLFGGTGFATSAASSTRGSAVYTPAASLTPGVERGGSVNEASEFRVRPWMEKEREARGEASGQATVDEEELPSYDDTAENGGA